MNTETASPAPAAAAATAPPPLSFPRHPGDPPFLQHDPDQPADMLKTSPNDDGLGRGDAADALRYLVATRPRCVGARVG